MQYKFIALLLLLSLVALVQGVAVPEPNPEPNYKKPKKYNSNSCKKQCHSALQPVSDHCSKAYPHGNHYARDGSGMDLSKDVDFTAIFSSITLGTFSDGCHKCFFEVAITCIFNYQQTYWDTKIFAACIDTVVIDCWNK